MGLALKCLGKASGTSGAQHPSSYEHRWLPPRSLGGHAAFSHFMEC